MLSEDCGFWNVCNYLTKAESPVARFGSIFGDSIAIRPQNPWSSHREPDRMRHNFKEDFQGNGVPTFGGVQEII